MKDQDQEIEELHERIDNLEELISKLAFLTNNREMVKKFNIPAWQGNM